MTSFPTTTSYRTNQPTNLQINEPTMRILNIYESPSFELDDTDRHLAQTMAIRLGAGVVSALACAGLVRVWWVKNLSE